MLIFHRFPFGYSSVNNDRNLVSVCFFVKGARFVLQPFTSSVQESVVFNVKKSETLERKI